ncbi:hypothetical protein NDU88_002314 [Pleurodeles waltl]|uniref:Uncharacterized protein n=1 Tax=Pleurodeles waltl TaxID=8319 RepID=A0AAV7NDC7_PLEWA|nr:hypothetical protein NDU88_002314 [Pleurodeles waltl]
MLRLAGRKALPGSQPHGAHHAGRKGVWEKLRSLSNSRDRKTGRPRKGTQRSTRSALGGPAEKQGELGGVTEEADEESSSTPGKEHFEEAQPRSRRSVAPQGTSAGRVMTQDQVRTVHAGLLLESYKREKKRLVKKRRP